MTTARVNLATTIHKAVRKILFDHAMLLARTDFRKEDECSSAREQLTLAFELLREHADAEDAWIFPAVAAADPRLASEAAIQHASLESTMHDIERLASALTIVTSSERLETGERLRARFHAFVAEQLAHLAFEETALHEALWRVHSDDELLALHVRIRASIPERHGPDWQRLILASIDAGERAVLAAQPR